MIAIASLLTVLTISLLVTRVATMTLMLTGMSRESARFQARSAFTGCGYTTNEAEDIVGHPVRRRIVMLLMLMGNLGIGAVVATIMVSFMNTTQVESGQRTLNIITLLIGLFLLWLVATNQYIERRLNIVIAWVLRRWGNLQVRDFVAVLQLQGGFAVSELLVEPRDWIADKTLIELRLPTEGVLVLGLQRPGKPYVGAPTGDTTIEAGDTLILYGRVERIEELDERRHGRRGDAAHKEAVEEHEQEKEEQEEHLEDDEAAAD
ncbi:potassium/proton antiporter [Posidoniimonas polymericola]|uniref:Potassium/proton antiporter n=1 Tax=Posidoniimonas polymericola TaxID=2528002 RepID=A0A5C5ZFV6_9BACT|nr:TrkA C-terminal domain-containing protein [Posidoniimonas polymericola]TWT85990.1 potassium/proton antiporter [Posidoniimonas polymericola]